MLSTRLAARIGTGHVALAVFGCLVTGVQRETETETDVDTPAIVERRAPVPGECSGWNASSLPGLEFIDIERVAADDVWVIAKRGGLYHWDGCTWRAHEPFAELVYHIVEWHDLAVDDFGRMWLRGTRPGGGWQQRSGCLSGDYEYPPSQAIYVLDGTTWRSADANTAPPPTRELVFEPAALGNDRKILVTSGIDGGEQWAIVERFPRDNEVWRYRDDRWTAIHVPTHVPFRGGTHKDVDGMRIRARGGAAPDNVWLVGERSRQPEARHDDGRILTEHGSRFPAEARNRTTLLAVWSQSPSDTWVVGEHGLVMHWDGATWTVLPRPTFQTLDSVRIEDGVLVVGSPGVTYRYRLP